MTNSNILLIISGLIIHYLSEKESSDHKHSIKINNYHYHRSWLLASFTGITSGLQNITFIILGFHSTTLFQSSNSFWVWPPFLLTAALPMLLGFWYRSKNNLNSVKNIEQRNWFLGIRNISLVILMGLFFTGSLALYSSGMSQMSHQQQIVGWPAFMVSISLISQAWGWLYKESPHAIKRSKLYELGSIGYS